jgi:hypothetical protein
MMKAVFLLLCVLKFVSLENARNNQIIAPAISQIVYKFYANRSENFDFIIFGNETKTLSDIAEKVMKSTEVPYRVIEIEPNENEMKVNQSAIFFFKSVISYKNFQTRLVLNNQYPKKLNFLVYIEEETNNFTALAPQKPLEAPIFLQSCFVIKKSNSKMVQLLSFAIFYEKKCNGGYISPINFFFASTKTWMNSNFFPTKFNNFNGCELTVAFSHPQTLIFDVTNPTPGKYHISGYGITFIDQIAKSLNFKCKYFPALRSGFSYGKHSSRKKLWDVFIFANSLRKVQSLKQTSYNLIEYGFSTPGFATHSFTTVDYIVVISQPSPYTPFEKIFLPFEVEVWYSLIFTLLFAVVVIIALKCLPKYMQHFTFGSKVKTPVLNLL